MTAEPDGRTPAESRLHDALDAVAADRPVPDAWSAIRNRVTDPDGGRDRITLAPPAPVSRTAHPARRWLAAAAVLVLVAGAAVIALAGRDDGGDDDAVTSGSREPTGFYVPEGLPEGWTVDAVRLDRSGTSCPCSQRTWTSPDGSATVDVRTGDAGRGDLPEFDGGPDPIDLGSGIEARAVDGAVATLEWTGDAGVATVLTAAGLTRAELEAAGRAVVAAADPEAPPTPGVTLLASWEQADAEPSIAPTVTVEVTTAAGHRLGYALTRPGTFRFPVGPTVRERTVTAGQPAVLDVSRNPEAPPLRFSGDVEPPLTYGLWPEADVTGPLQVGETGEGPTAEEADTLLASLRPADAGRWRSFVDGATDGDPAAIAATLAALAGPDVEDPGPSVTTTGVPPESSATPTTTTAPGTSEPGPGEPTTTEGTATVVLSVVPGRSLAATTTTVPWDPGGGPDPLDVERRVETEPIEVEVRPGAPVSIVVEIVNRTDDTLYLPGCFPGGAAWNLSRDGDPAVYGGNYTIDCGEAPQPLAPGGSRRTEAFVLLTAGGRTDSGTPLSPGRYEAVIALFFLEEPVRVPVVITP